ncbi:MAG: thioredoxin family protein [Desulfobacula sp.]|jgi:small redox-active disulfide protein 2|uniref:thioredoxin family protein n=1 Tax=Desulfobacula sp. TaxID=2593537 RepID=UPI001D31ACD3|nr:thioredoxin family protein [Desulfobacula sp.]MBT3486123.1 thioredoxin family protein [Desulfobacula sp.]MBT3805854.1 thioredoxin family protein [Desulfobacula sp.]MBT4026141.1 thioredoxin family protein [Desulfobacula sp.]MBT4200236.1 thioredoxin family protein [Desulfobacula sp.]
MKIQILGTGCKSCDTLYENVTRALEKTQLNLTAQLEKVNDIDYFSKMGVFTTPGLVIEGELISAGKVVTEQALIEILNSKK